jgi:hypothetical protein
MLLETELYSLQARSETGENHTDVSVLWLRAGLGNCQRQIVLQLNAVYETKIDV